MEEDIKVLEKYENYFHTAIKYDYIKALWDDDLKIIIPIYERLTEQKYTGCSYCSHSRLALMKKLGKIYYDIKKQAKET